MSRRQERESARTEVTEVAPDILRLELPIRIPGLGHVNCYALIDSEGAAIVDPGLPGPGAWRTLQDRMARAGISAKHVHTVIVTHSHPDHFGGAARFHKESGAKVIAHHSFYFGPGRPGSDQPEVSVDDLPGKPKDDGEADEDLNQPPKLVHSWRGATPWGSSRTALDIGRRLLWRTLMFMGRVPWVPEITHPIGHGDELKLAGRDFFAVHTPGHTADHLCLHDPETGTFLAGDHVLPTITPHISGLSESRDPLASFFYSLDRVAEISHVGQVLPAHGHPFTDLAERAEAIKRHHYERLDRIKEIAREIGPGTVPEFSSKLFPPRSWGLMAEAETYAHLEHLLLAGEAERRRRSDGMLVYETG